MLKNSTKNYMCINANLLDDDIIIFELFYNIARGRYPDKDHYDLSVSNVIDDSGVIVQFMWDMVTNQNDMINTLDAIINIPNTLLSLNNIENKRHDIIISSITYDDVRQNTNDFKNNIVVVLELPIDKYGTHDDSSDMEMINNHIHKYWNKNENKTGKMIVNCTDNEIVINLYEIDMYTAMDLLLNLFFIGPTSKCDIGFEICTQEEYDAYELSEKSKNNEILLN